MESTGFTVHLRQHHSQSCLLYMTLRRACLNYLVNVADLITEVMVCVHFVKSEHSTELTELVSQQ